LREELLNTRGNINEIKDEDLRLFERIKEELTLEDEKTRESMKHMADQITHIDAMFKNH
jgi:hypothetical protein